MSAQQYEETMTGDESLLERIQNRIFRDNTKEEELHHTGSGDNIDQYSNMTTEELYQAEIARNEQIRQEIQNEENSKPRRFFGNKDE